MRKSHTLHLPWNCLWVEVQEEMHLFIVVKRLYQRLAAFDTSFSKNGKAIKHKMVIKINLWNRWKEKQRNAPWMSKPQNLSRHAVFNRNVQQTPQAHAAEHIWMLQVYLEWPLQVGGREWNKEFELSRPSQSYSKLSVWLRGPQSNIYTSDTITHYICSNTQTPLILLRELAGYML